MGVGGSSVGGSGDNLGGFLVAHVVDGKCVLVVAVADILAIVFSIWSTVYKALGLRVSC